MFFTYAYVRSCEESKTQQRIEHAFKTRQELLNMYDEATVMTIINSKTARGEYLGRLGRHVHAKRRAS